LPANVKRTHTSEKNQLCAHDDKVPQANHGMSRDILVSIYNNNQVKEQTSGLPVAERLCQKVEKKRCVFPFRPNIFK
jgi:hypothetical protein